MLVELPRADGIDQPVRIPASPIKLSKVAEGPERRVPWLGEHTDEVLSKELGMATADLEALRANGFIGP
jgi:crotonobetainyl-CoA:carnitine CoA-transferase CaiB-like acyl-CoA transferase